MPPRVKSTQSTPKRESTRVLVNKMKTEKNIEQKLIAEKQKKLSEYDKANKYCLKDNKIINEKLLMLAVSSIADNLHDFAGARSSLTPPQIAAIIKIYLGLLKDAKNEEMTTDKSQKIYSDLLNKINTTESGIDKAFKDIYSEYFDNNLTEPELDWASLVSSQESKIRDNFEVIIGDKKALMDLSYKRDEENSFLKKLREIVQKNETLGGTKEINFVIDVSTIGNDIFVDKSSKIYKGAAGFFDDFHRPENNSTNYVHEEIPFTVNIQNIISNSSNCILNHVALNNFEINKEGKLFWISKYLTDQTEREIKISQTILSEFGVSKYSELIDASVKRNPNTVQKTLLTRFHEITGLPSSLLNSTDYGKHIFDFKRLMDSSQIMYTYYLNKINANEGKKFIFVTHDNMAAVIARLIGVPCIQTHIYSHIRTISVHLGTNKYIEKNDITTIHNNIFNNAKEACSKYKDILLVEPKLFKNFNEYLEGQLKIVNPIVKYSDILIKLITKPQSFLNPSDLSLIYIFKLILTIYISFLNNAQEQLNKYISKINENIDYDNFKQLKDNNDILNVNYTLDTLKKDYDYIKSLIDKLNKFKYTDFNGTLYKQFYEIIKEDNGYMFSTIDFKILIVCLMNGIEKNSLRDTMDFYTDSYDKIEIITNKNDKNKDAFNYVTSNKHSLKRYFKQISDLNKQYPSKSLSIAGGGDELYGIFLIDSQPPEDLIKANLVIDFFESIHKKQDLRDYYHAISKPSPTPEDINIAKEAQKYLRGQIENEKLYAERRLLERKRSRSRSQLTIYKQAARQAAARQEAARQEAARQAAARIPISSQYSISPMDLYHSPPPTPPHWGGRGGNQRFSFFKEFQRKLKL